MALRRFCKHLIVCPWGAGGLPLAISRPAGNRRETDLKETGITERPSVLSITVRRIGIREIGGERSLSIFQTSKGGLFVTAAIL